MSQFMVYRNKSTRTKSIFPFLVDVQSDLLEQLQTRVVVPLTKAPALLKKPISHLTPTLKFEGETFVLMVPQLVGMPRAELGTTAGALANERHVILAAIDFLLTGF